MEVATTNNHSQSHHQRLPHHSLTSHSTSGGVDGGVRSPFQREVREWQRVDPDTGALLTGRLEADRWLNGPLNSYGKISDSQNISQPNGTQQTQRKQLEVLQARTANGAMQVIRSQTVQTTSSRWSSASASSSSSPILARNGGSSLFHNYSHYHKPHLAEIPNNNNHRQPTTTSQPASTLNSCELSDDDNDSHIIHHDTDEDQYFLTNGSAKSKSKRHNNVHNNHFSHRHSFNNSNNQLFNGSSNLLLDMAPSLKLSNLMKSTSSISSNNSSNNSTTASTTAQSATATMNAYKRAAKISLHSIVGNNNDNNNSNSDRKSSLPTPATTAASWQAPQSPRNSRLFEQPLQQQHQPAIYGNGNSLTKFHVGVSNCDEAGAGGGGVVGDGAAAAGSFADELRHNHQSNGLTPTQLNRQPRRDLESFRHYNDPEIASSANGVDDDDDLRLSARHLRRQQNPLRQHTVLQRSRSISTDDLSTEWDTPGGDSEEPGEWQRVSKLRRSFQSTLDHNDTYNTRSISRRPIDLPTNSVSVSKIRAELENGRRLNTAMRNNHLNLAALDTILNASSEVKPAPAKRTTFLTAESLKEIRGKLKKLSDESLYKEDFIGHQQPSMADEQIEVQHVRQAPERKLRQLTPEQSPEISSPPSAFQVFARESPTAQNSLSQRLMSNGQNHTTNSLESRQKYRDTASTEWHNRRKSYGFEKMSPPTDRSMFRMDASTDSGLGRSGELGNWSPTESVPPARGTVIQFGEPAKMTSAATAVRRRYRPLKSPDESEEEVLKRHSIAVDESQYVRDNLRKTSQVHLNGFYDKHSGDAVPNPTATTLFQRTQQKRVEFCKTEVHFAAESGRVNIVETDGKPPPTNNFRRRRRTASGPLQSLIKSTATVSSSSSSSSSVGLPITQFGDDQRRKTIATTTVAYKASLVDALDDTEPTNVTISIPKRTESYTYTESSRNSYVDAAECETDEISAIRGILKNKPIKPRPYHLGENIDRPDALWGVQLKPIVSSTLTDKHEILPNVSKLETPNSSPNHNKSVAERVRMAEKRQDHSISGQTVNGFSTKINLSLGDTHKDWTETGMHSNQIERRPSAQELMLQDLREHQRILDEGLKSTSLIIKTMRSASEFDEAMRRLSIASMEAAVIPPIVVPTPMLRSYSYQESTRRYSASALDDTERQVASQSAIYTSATTIRRLSAESHNTNVPPVAAPRLKLLGNTETPVSQQLTQLRRMYEVANSQEDDSADEEVKSYFRGHNDNSDSGGGTQDSSSMEEERSIEYSNSWSRLKAKRTVWKIGVDDSKREVTLERKELPKSNIMSIELHSPQSSVEKPPSLTVMQTTPIAKPRTISGTQQTNHSPVRQATHSTNEPTKEPLKIIKEARGARRLRDHELSYFGVQVTNDAKTKMLPNTNEDTPKRTLLQRKVSADNSKTMTPNELKKDKQATKWLLINDKPDLLRHSPIPLEPKVLTRTAQVRPTERKNIKNVRSTVEILPESEEEYDEHLYENITNEITPVFKAKSPVGARSYNRKTDLKRDAMILNEMTKNADQTLKAISDEAASKDQRRRSIHRHHSRPLETIDEKAIGEKINGKCIAVKVSRGTLASDAKRTSNRSTPSPTRAANYARSSSQSSVESCPEVRSRSLSNEREPLKLKATPNAGTTKSKLVKAADSRSSSRESHSSSYRQCCSSGDEERVQREERLRGKTKGVSSSMRTGEKYSKDQIRKEKHQSSTGERRHRSSHADKQHLAGTTHSPQRERIECSMEAMSPHHHHLQREHEVSSSSRRHRDAPHLTEAVDRATDEKRDKRGRTSGSSSRLVRTPRAHEHDVSQRSSHRSERTDKEKEKLSRSRGHSSRSTSHKSEQKPVSPHQSSSHVTTPTKAREHKQAAATTTTATKTSSTEMKPHETMTYSKNAPLINGHYQYPYQQHPHHIHSMTTKTIAAKHRERHGKDRK